MGAEQQCLLETRRVGDAEILFPSQIDNTATNSENDTVSDETETEDEDDDERMEYLEYIRVRSIEGMHEHLNTAKNYWKASQTQYRLRAIIEQQPPIFLESISRIVCIGLGTIAEPSGEADQENSRMQLACLLDIANIIREQLSSKFGTGAGSNTLQICAQEPKFSDLDKDLLRSQNIAVVDDPDIWQLVDDSTLVFAPFFPIYALPREFYSRHFRRGKGAPAIISNPLEETHKPMMKDTRQWRKLSRNMLKTYRSTRFPHSLDYKRDDKPFFGGACWDTEGNLTDEGNVTKAFRGLYIYLRKDLGKPVDLVQTSDTLRKEQDPNVLSHNQLARINLKTASKYLSDSIQNGFSELHIVASAR